MLLHNAGSTVRVHSTPSRPIFVVSRLFERTSSKRPADVNFPSSTVGSLAAAARAKKDADAMEESGRRKTEIIGHDRPMGVRQV